LFSLCFINGKSITYHHPIYRSKELFLMTNASYLKPFGRVRSNHPF
jgi:hypothetical protein